MIQFTKNIVFALIFFASFISLKVDAQNLFDKTNSEKYANYLFQAQEYEFAIQEFERLIFLDSINQAYPVLLAQSFRFSQNFNDGIQRIKVLYPDPLKMYPPMASEYAKLLVLGKQFQNAYHFCEQSDSLQNKSIYLISIQLMQAEWNEALTAISANSNKDNPFTNDLYKIALEGTNMKYKSPFLAGTFSAIIPGTGKVYSNQWKDGLIAFLFVAGNAWQSYRGFKDEGIKSPYGWVFGSLAVGFYGGNVFGSVKAAKTYNSNLDHALINKTENLLIGQF